MKLEEFAHSVDNPYIWAVILLVSLRAVYKCAMTKDWAHLGAFLIVGAGSIYMIGACLGVFDLPSVFK